MEEKKTNVLSKISMDEKKSILLYITAILSIASFFIWLPIITSKILQPNPERITIYISNGTNNGIKESSGGNILYDFAVKSYRDKLEKINGKYLVYVDNPSAVNFYVKNENGTDISSGPPTKGKTSVEPVQVPFISDGVNSNIILYYKSFTPFTLKRAEIIIN